MTDNHTTNERYDRGLEALNRINGNNGNQVLDSLADVAPDLGRWIIEQAGDVYPRPELDMRQRELVTLASLTTQGDTHDQLVVHINGALNVGLSRAEVTEAFLHCVPYVGFPKVLNAVSVLREVLATRGAGAPSES
ncbi:carboxymuconolactone decarboxylase family protein [Propionibacterium freudenreichii]|uniref:carboxymuconolactone decarboxylase family protein n=1 Tax=Propionibacterium freudenreichii TaxID=1744 RepID=UPI000BC31151|nr:carboxymuconolactone decarboxylase family protein [Propionibacterium freudenreichii]MDK9296093.1 carboxymuconolactone decarboxylase family protein [Propionibacterium freudenreichii]MDK9361487.1 carboxymuconolactone decarboxylase family protein [Propionibacterium freudenreichii]MDK9638950.1 carboxymuconolactone decarboxylase family protein [Propionibacterium freudenreichii]MDK9654603.1 carboxymuconolactone decarboxylase family protein [Propionibacterium freudenreichii]MDK9660610.1 carboxymuc